MRKAVLVEARQIYRAVGRRIRLARQAAACTQDDLARRVGLTRASISNIESGRQQIQVHTLVGIAQALSMRPESLLAYTRESGRDLEDLLPGDLAPADREWVRMLIERPAV
jgi:transcriptional regulator with XRE-family HTH domain